MPDPSPHWNPLASDADYDAAFRAWAMAEQDEPRDTWEIARRDARRLFEQYAVATESSEAMGRALAAAHTKITGLEEQYQAALRAVGCDHTLRNDDDKQDALWEYVHHDGGTWIRCKGCGTLERWQGGFRFEVRLEPVSNPAKRPT